MTCGANGFEFVIGGDASATTDLVFVSAFSVSAREGRRGTHPFSQLPRKVTLRVVLSAGPLCLLRYTAARVSQRQV